MKKKKRGTVTAFGSLLRRLLRPFKRKPERSEVTTWLAAVEALIGKHSGPPIHFGHSQTDSLAWVRDLALLVQADIVRKNRGRTYDGNMALAARLGAILVLWYAHVHRCKSYDPNRPLEDRKAAAAQRVRFLAELQAALLDESIAGEVWGRKQQWNYPFGKGARGGKFV